MYSIKSEFTYYCFKTAFKYYIYVSQPRKDTCNGVRLLGYVR